ncbi:DNA polymerase III subunit alpha [Paraliobacillus sp. X-1268]|uniref:DNA polymerase III subunit alpha n=1 Tax=Paraliobacillus sp. X-1268 TaxID=2213193 RepID=UPI000E3E0325|nr:DNA polymerase III subunit alpha [Paraliobacillus sp. X-1268]
MAFTHLQVRSGYSMMKSTVKLNKLVEQAKEFKMDAIALTDENVLHGAVSFYRLCINADMKPIIGMVISVQENTGETIQIIALAKNNQGYKNLLQISSIIQTAGIGFIDQKDLLVYGKDIIFILPVANSALEHLAEANKAEEMAVYINEWNKVIPDLPIYIGIQSIDKSNFSILKQVCDTLPNEAVAISDVRYLRREDHKAYDCLRAMEQGKKWAYQTETSARENHYYKTPEEVARSYEQWPELIQKASEVVDQCNVKLVLDQPTLPKFPLAETHEKAAYLKELCEKAFITKYPNATADIRNRLERELDVINRMQFSDYFLIVWDFVQYAKQHSIMVGPGRGSAAGSIVAYLLDITEVDPIRYDLLFERFLNPDRVSMPDIDIDFSDHRRDEVIAYVKEKYGKDHVAQIGTFGTFATRSVIRELCKTMEITAEEQSFILKEIPNQGAKSVAESLRYSTSLMDYVKQSNQLQQLFKIATKLEGLPRHLSTHAAGIVISESPLVESTPLTTSGNEEMYLTQFAMKDIEAVGLLKMDFLGLRNLTLIERIVRTVEQNEKRSIIVKDIPLNDRATFELLQRGGTNGVFQLESQGMQRVLKDLYPTEFEDIVAVNALYRPGPMEFIPTYVNRKHGKEPMNYAHPDLKAILEPTYGVLIYQEQIMQISNKMAGFTYGQADILRRAVSKKQKEQMEQLEQQFIQGCITNGYQQKVAEELFTWIIRFSNYGFNRSHAVAYSLISYQLAYLKANYPAYFLTDILSSVAGQHDKISLYAKEAKELGIEILQPSINKSYGGFMVEKGNIRMGLWSIKGIGNQVIKEILQARKAGKFKHLFDFCLRVPVQIVNRPALEALIMAGAFDETNNDRAKLLATIDQALEQGELFSDFEDQTSFFRDDLQLDVSYVEVEPFTTMQQLALEKDLLGMYVSSHPLTVYREKFRANGYLSLTQLQNMIGKNNRHTVVVVQQIKVIRTKRGDQMAFLTLADEEMEMDAVVFPDVYREINRWIKEEMLVVIKGKSEERQNKIQLLVTQISQFDDMLLEEVSNKQRLFVQVDQQTERDALQLLKQLAEKHPGKTPVIVYHSHKDVTYQLAPTYNLELERECLRKLNDTLGKENVVVKK